MPIDTSIYQNLQQPQVQAPNPLQSMQQAMQIGQMGMQQMQQARLLKNQSDIQDAMYRNTDPQTGQLDQNGVLTTLGKTNPLASQQMGESFAAHNKAQAEAQSARADAEMKATQVVLPHLEYLNSTPDDQKTNVYHSIMQTLADKGIPMHNVPADFSQPWLDQTMATIKNTPAYLAQQKAIAEIPKAQAEIKNEQFGSRSPVSTLTDQYSSEPSVKTARSSQVAMKQMYDNYHNHSPQGDASLLVTAYKIKNPDKPDVNTIDELRTSEPVSAQWKSKANQMVNGLLPDDVRDDLMRDAISTFRANKEGLEDTQAKYKAYAAANGIQAPNLAEPAIKKTWANASALQDKIGPYVPPAQRGGVSGAISGVLSKITGTGGNQPAQAQENNKYRQSGASVSADELAQYATKHGMKLKDAQSYLKGHGYVIGR